MSFMRLFSETPEKHQTNLSVDEIETKLINANNFQEIIHVMTTISQSDDGAHKLYDAVKNMETALRFHAKKQGQMLHLVFSGHQKFCKIMKALDDMSTSYDKWSNYFSDEYKQKHPEEYQSLEAEMFKMFGENEIHEYKKNCAFLDQFSAMLIQDKKHYQRVVTIHNHLILKNENNNNLLDQFKKALW